ncbi:MAG TPA: cytochrome P460 family protein [Bryobacteraceae bacterium]|jgi:hypothetical protein|nr:cytochrome P460 family protein [Bryobacteraceae bacterium]
MKHACCLALILAAAATAQTYTKNGEMLLPKDYRSWDFLTSSLGLNYPEEGPPKGEPPFGNVFVNPKARQAYLKTGVWPDKTVLVLEVRKAQGRPGLDKNQRFQTNVQAIEAHVKDSSRGGWMFYAFPNGSANGKPIEKTAQCYSCHEKNAAVDTTFVQYYPTLIDTAKQHGTYKDVGE